MSLQQAVVCCGSILCVNVAEPGDLVCCDLVKTKLRLVKCGHFIVYFQLHVQKVT